MVPVEPRRYITGLDGLRAVAVLAVIAYHLGMAQARGGLLGVDVFFVISGYLITDQLAAEYRRSGRIALGHFWLRRARRLLPALYAMLLIVAAYLALVDPARLVNLRGDLLAAWVYVSNWWFIFHKVSYFARFGPPSPLGHLWSLAVEEQFYLLWPLLLLAGLRLLRRRSRLVPAVLGLAAASALAMALLFQPGGDPTRVYDGTDTRAFALLIGAALALLWPSGAPPRAARPPARLALEAAGAAGLLVIGAMLAWSDEYGSFLYQGGMVLVSVATAAVIAAATPGEGRIARLLSWAPLRWIGLRSYGIYLWHYPVIALTTPVSEMNEFRPERAAIQVGATLLIAALSYRFVEEPFRRGAARRWWEAAHDAGETGRWLRARGWATAAAAALVVALASWGLAGLAPLDGGRISGSGWLPAAGSLDPAPSPAASASPVPGQGGGGAPLVHGPGRRGDQLLPAPGGGSGERPAGRVAGAKPGGGGAAAEEPQAGPGKEVTAIGDSVLLDVAPYLRELLPGAVIDGRVGRQLVEAPKVVAELRAQGKLGDRVIIELGTNGPFTRDQLAALLDDLRSAKEVVLVNVRVPRPWERSVNATIDATARRFPRVRVVDWYGASAGKAEYFYPDGVHLNPEGARAYAEMLAQAVKPGGSP
ncbi:MAG: acyltransferase family protein [Bacillota bacterium]|nr:acyltransferase family protein [Bacillota bacterium]